MAQWVIRTPPRPCVTVRERVREGLSDPNGAVIVVKMAEEEAERESNTREVIVALRKRFQELITALKESSESPVDASSSFCQEFCQVCSISHNATKTASFLIDDVAL